MSSIDPIHRPVTAWAGLAVLAGMLLVVSGFFTLVQALLALFDDAFYVQADGQTVVLSLATWGWLHLVLGAAQLLVGVFVLLGSLWARATAAVILGLNAVAQMLFLPAYPLWSVAVIALNVLAIWALCMHGSEVRDV
jgi:hypothetical protein